jgi:hypothetical protein
MLNLHFLSLAVLCFHTRVCLLYSDKVAALEFNIFYYQEGVLFVTAVTSYYLNNN